MMELRYARPEEIGIDPERLRSARRVIQRGLDDGLYPGAVYVIGRNGRILGPECFGGCDPDGSRPVTPDTLYDLASLTKPIATATSLLILLERGEIHLGMRSAVLRQAQDGGVPDRKSGKTGPGSDIPAQQDSALRHPELVEGPHSALTLRQLLTHTSGLPAEKDFYSAGQNKEEVIASVLSTPLEAPPGSAYIYSCLGYILLGRIVESVSGMGLDEFARENIFGPLGMADTMFKPCGEILDRTAATANCPARKRTLVGEVHDGNAWAMGGVSGNAGLFSTAPDLARFCAMMLLGRERVANPPDVGPGLQTPAHRREAVLSPASIRLCFQNLLDPAIGGQTAGWFIHPNDRLPSGELMSRQTIGHTGFTGTSVAIDPDCDLFVILLTNRVCRADDGMEFRRTRRLFHNAVAQAVLS